MGVAAQQLLQQTPLPLGLALQTLPQRVEQTHATAMATCPLPQQRTERASASNGASACAVRSRKHEVHSRMHESHITNKFS